MNSISPFLNSAMTIVTQVLANGVQHISKWANHSVRFIQLIPQHMQQNRNVAFAVVATTNAVFFFTIHSIVNRLDKRLEHQATPLTPEQRTIKHLLLNGVILGGSLFSANLLLSKATQYPLNKSLAASIATAAIISRILLNQVEKYLASNEKDIDQEQQGRIKIASPREETQIKVKNAQTSSQNVEVTNETDEKTCIEDRFQAAVDKLFEEDQTLKEPKSKPKTKSDQAQAEATHKELIKDKDKALKQTQERKTEAPIESMTNNKQVQEEANISEKENDKEFEEEVLSQQQQLKVENKFIEDAEEEINTAEQEKRTDGQKQYQEFLEGGEDAASEDESSHVSEASDPISDDDQDMQWIFDFDDDFNPLSELVDQSPASITEDSKDFSKTKDQPRKEAGDIPQQQQQIVVAKPKSSQVVHQKMKKREYVVQPMFEQSLDIFSSMLNPSIAEQEEQQKEEEKSSKLSSQLKGLAIHSGTPFSKGLIYAKPRNKKSSPLFNLFQHLPFGLGALYPFTLQQISTMKNLVTDKE